MSTFDFREQELSETWGQRAYCILALFQTVDPTGAFMFAGNSSAGNGFGIFGELGVAGADHPDKFTYAKGAEIYRENEAADHVYQVTVGAARSFKLLPDGRRQIVAFHLVGDVFGLENTATHRFTAEAIVDTAVWAVKRPGLELIAKSDATVIRNLLSMTTRNLQHAEDQMLLLGRKTSLERVAAFLLEMDTRLVAVGVLALPMSRRDIADYLGLALETVSRALSLLHEQGIVGFHDKNQRQIVLRDRQQLAALDLSD